MFRSQVIDEAGFDPKRVFKILTQGRYRNRYELRPKFGNRNRPVSESGFTGSVSLPDFVEMNSVESVERISADGESDLEFQSEISDEFWDGKTKSF